MRGNELLDKLQLLDPDLIQAAAEKPEKPPSLWRRISPLPLKEARKLALVEDPAPPRKPRPALFAGACLLCLCLLLAPVLLNQAGPEGFEGQSAAGGGEAEAGCADFHSALLEQLGISPESLFQENKVTGAAAFYDSDKMELYEDPLAKLFSIVGLEGRKGSLMDWEDCYFVTDYLESLHPRTAPAFFNGKFSAMVLTEGAARESSEKSSPAVQEFYAAWRFGSPEGGGVEDAIVLSVSRQEKDWQEFEAFVQAGNSQSLIEAGGFQFHTTGTDQGERGLWFQKDSTWIRLYGSSGVSSRQLLEVLGWAFSGLEGMAVPDSAGLWQNSFRQYRWGSDPGLLSVFFPPAGLAPAPASSRVLESRCGGPSPAGAELAFREEEGGLLKSWTVFAENDYQYATPYDRANSLGELQDITQKSLEECCRKGKAAGVFQLFFQHKGFQIRGEYRDLGQEAAAEQLWALISQLQKEAGRFSAAARWTEDFSPEDYFQHSALPGEKESLNGVFGIGYGSVQGERGFSRYRQELEAEGVMPWSDPNQEFSAWAAYDDKGGLELLTVTWTYLDEANNPVSFLTMECSPKAREGYPDRIWDGGMLYSKTVIHREGTEITAIGFSDTPRCLCYETENGWYQFYCSANTNEYELVPLLDFFWLFPVDFNRFSQDRGDRYEMAELKDYPEAFSGFYPTDPRFCPELLHGELQLLQGDPVYLHLSYDSAQGAQPVIDWSLYAEGCTMLPNRIITEYWNAELCIGELGSLTPEDLAAYMETDAMKYNHRFIFSWNGYLAAASLRPETTGEELWELILHLREQSPPGG